MTGGLGTRFRVRERWRAPARFSIFSSFRKNALISRPSGIVRRFKLPGAKKRLVSGTKLMRTIGFFSAPRQWPPFPSQSVRAQTNGFLLRARVGQARTTRPGSVVVCWFFHEHFSVGNWAAPFMTGDKGPLQTERRTRRSAGLNR